MTFEVRELSMAFSEILGQDAPIALLQRTIQQHRLPSAYLFAGPHHIGKQKTAHALAQAVNCEKSGADACRNCNHCLQIENDEFPDYSVVRPQGQFVKISQIKQAIRWLQLRPDLGTHRILVIDEAERMNLESANAFLKTLEEPPPQTLIILLAEQPQQLLETIVSRCQLIRFHVLKQDHVQQILQKNEQLTPEQTQFLAYFSMGQVKRDWIEKIEFLMELRDSMIRFLDQLGITVMEEVFALIDKTGTKEGNWPYLLDFLEYWFRDLAWLLNGLDHQHLFNRDREEELQRMLPRWSQDRVREAHDLLTDTRIRIQQNANLPLALQSLWIQFRRKFAE